MIYDFGTEVTLSPPTGSDTMTWSDAVDLKDGGDGVPLIPAGDTPFMQFEVTTAFTVSAGTPLPQFGVALGTTDPLGDNSIVLCMTGGVIDGLGGLCGLTAASLTAGTMFHLPIPQWDDLFGTLSSSFRYLGICCQNVAATPASNDFAGTGVIKARVVHRAAMQASQQSYLFGSRMRVS